MERSSQKRRASWTPPKRDGTRSRHLKTTGQELEIALDAAERLLAQGQEDTRHAQNIRFAAVSLSLLTVASMAGIVIAIVESARVGGLIAIAVLVSAAGPAALYLLRLLHEVDRGGQSLHLDIALEIAGMVREVFLDVAEREGWSRVRVESTRLRLSAFPLRPHSAEVRAMSSISPERAVDT